MESTSPATDLECLEKILENSEKCYEFFMGKFELDQDNFKYQMTQLAKMSYMTLLHLEEEFKQDARKLDAKNINKHDVRERLNPLTLSSQKRINRSLSQ